MVYRNPYDGYSEEGGGYSCQEEYAGCREPDSQYYTHQAQVRKVKWIGTVGTDREWTMCESHLEESVFLSSLGAVQQPS